MIDTSLRRVPPLLVLLSTLGLAAPAASQNLLSNHAFDVNVSGWAIQAGLGGASVTWNARDWLAAPGSGSALFSNNATFSNAEDWLEQCVPITAGAVIDYGAHFYVPSGQASTGFVFSAVQYFSSPGCVNFLSGPTGTASLSLFDTWAVARANALVVPAGAVSLKLLAIVVKHESTGSFRAHVDEPFVGNTGTVPVTLQRFDAE